MKFWDRFLETFGQIYSYKGIEGQKRLGLDNGFGMKNASKIQGDK